jgi:hypothetical protein
MKYFMPGVNWNRRMKKMESRGTTTANPYKANEMKVSECGSIITFLSHTVRTTKAAKMK